MQLLPPPLMPLAGRGEGNGVRTVADPLASPQLLNHALQSKPLPTRRQDMTPINCCRLQSYRLQRHSGHQRLPRVRCSCCRLDRYRRNNAVTAATGTYRDDNIAAAAASLYSADFIAIIADITTAATATTLRAVTNAAATGVAADLVDTVADNVAAANNAKGDTRATVASEPRH